MLVRQGDISLRRLASKILGSIRLLWISEFLFLIKFKLEPLCIIAVRISRFFFPFVIKKTPAGDDDWYQALEMLYHVFNFLFC